MATSIHDECRSREGKNRVKDEYEEKLLDSVPYQSTIAQFIRSRQAAFGSLEPELLNEHSSLSKEVQKSLLESVRERLAAASELSNDDILALRPLLKLEYSAAGLGNSNSTGVDCLLPELLRLMKSNFTCAVTLSNHVFDAPNEKVPRAIKEELLHNVAQILGAVSVDIQDQGAIKHQLTAFEDTEYGSGFEPQPQAKLTAAALGIFTKRLYSAGRFEPVQSMLARLQSEMVRVQSIDLHLVYVPYLQELIGLMLIYGVPLKNVVYSSFFEVLLQQYLERFVGQEADRAGGVEQEDRNQRAFAARAMLESFDHSYFRDILGDRYDRSVLPTLLKLPQVPPSATRSQAHNSLPTTASTQSRNLKTTATLNKDNIGPALS